MKRGTRAGTLHTSLYTAPRCASRRVGVPGGQGRRHAHRHFNRRHISCLSLCYLHPKNHASGALKSICCGIPRSLWNRWFFEGQRLPTIYGTPSLDNVVLTDSFVARKGFHVEPTKKRLAQTTPVPHAAGAHISYGILVMAY